MASIQELKRRSALRKQAAATATATATATAEPIFRVLSGDKEVEDHFQQLRATMTTQWDEFLGRMTAANIDLSVIRDPILNVRVKCHWGKQITLMVWDDPDMIETITNKPATDEYLYQIWHKHQSVILRLPRHPNRSTNWCGEVLPLTEAEQALTSMLLLASEGKGPYYVVDDIVKSVADKQHMVNVFRVLD